MTTNKKPSSIPANAKPVWSGTIFTAWQWEQKLYDGTTDIFEALTRADTVQVIGILPERRILLVEDEQPHRPIVLTPAGGRMEPEEKPEEAARREFHEETGYEIGELTPWYNWVPSSKVQSITFTFIAHDLKKTGVPHPDGGERITPKIFTFDEFLALGRTEQLRDLILRIRLLEALLDPAVRDKLEHLLFT